MSILIYLHPSISRYIGTLSSTLIYSDLVGSSLIYSGGKCVVGMEVDVKVEVEVQVEVQVE